MPTTLIGQYFTTVLLEPRLLEQRYHPLTRFSPALLKEARKARERFTRKGACALLLVIPPGIPVDAPSTNEDHWREESQQRKVIALAVVAEDSTMNAATKFYFRYYPQAFDAKVFAAEDEALEWLRAKLTSASPA